MRANLRMRCGIGICALLALVIAASVVAAAPAQTAPAGIDVSHWQGEIDWFAVRSAGIDFAFAKATEGTTFTDVTYPLNRGGANAVGVRIGAYHLARPSGTTDASIAASAIAQADAFLAFAQPAAGDLPPVLDLEHTGNLSVTQLTAWTQAWLDAVAARLGVRPIVYASPAFWKKYLGDTPVFAGAGDPLWIAHWTASALPILPGGGWGGLGWMFWQWSNCQHVKGISHCVDGDRFNGTSLDAVAIPGYTSGVPVAISRPTVKGTPQTGKLLTALPGSWRGAKPISFAYQWQSCTTTGAGCLPIAGATGETYTPTSAEIGRGLVVTVTAQAGGGAAAASSLPTLAVAGTAAAPVSAPTSVSRPTILGSAQVGQALSVQPGSWKGSPASFAYQWRRCGLAGVACTAIEGAATAGYTITPGDIGLALSVVVTATGKGGSRSATTASTPLVLPVAVPAPSIGSATAQPGQAGAVAVPDATATATWQPGAVPANGLVTLASTPSRLAVAGTSLTLAVGATVPLPWPIDLQYAAAAPDAVPGFLPGEGAWQPVSELAAPSLPDGQSFGAYRDSAGALHILTRTPGRIALFAPGKWGDPRFVSSHAPRLSLVRDVTVTRRADGAALVRGRMTLDTQAHLYVSVLTPRGQALVPQQGSRVGWWLKGLPTKTIQTLQLRPGEFPVRLVVPARQVSAAGKYALRLAATDPYGRTVRLHVPVPQLGASG